MPSYDADFSRFEERDTHVLGISIDSVSCNKAWAKSLGGITYDLLSDFEPKGEVARSYGAYRPEGYSERALFVVNKEGKIVTKIFMRSATSPITKSSLMCSENLTNAT